MAQPALKQLESTTLQTETSSVQLTPEDTSKRNLADLKKLRKSFESFTQYIEIPLIAYIFGQLFKFLILRTELFTNGF